MLIGGFQKSSLIDFKGRIAAVVFTQGCNFSCPYCHNPELVISMLSRPYSKEEIFSFLKTRINKLDGVVISGGEPTIHKDLPEFIKEIKNMGFEVKLDTNGTNPLMLKRLLDEKLLDYIAMDIKTSLLDYSRLIRREVKIENIKNSMEIIVKSGIEYEFRTTVVKGLLGADNFIKINEEFVKLRKLLHDEEKIKAYYLQKFQKSKHIDENFMNAKTFDDEEFEKLVKMFRENAEICLVR
ncbi:MAG: anaerobic ribonucleoside-triphosphate reductase activating protein [bacterium]|nr:anaerobic ribonucleoside-triphosphate reductase activating protein [bacterium]